MVGQNEPKPGLPKKRRFPVPSWIKWEITPVGVVTLVVLVGGGLTAWNDFTSLAQSNAEEIQSHIEAPDTHLSSSDAARLARIEEQAKALQKNMDHLTTSVDTLIKLQMEEARQTYQPYRAPGQGQP